jgi:D-alanyl-D-alanine carboxypeptidase
MEIYKDNRVLGGRTGVTNNRERCVASLARSGNMEIISIVMGTKSTYEPDGYSVRVEGGFPETSALLNYGFQGYRGVQLYHKDQVMRQHSVMGGNCDLFLGVDSDGFAVLPSGVAMSDLSFVYRDSFAGAYPNVPIEKGQVLSHLEVWYENICVDSADLYAMNSVTADAPVFVESMEPSPAMQWWGWALIGIGIFLVLFVAFMLSLRYIPAFRKLIFGRKKQKFRW